MDNDDRAPQGCPSLWDLQADPEHKAVNSTISIHPCFLLLSLRPSPCPGSRGVGQCALDSQAIGVDISCYSCSPRVSLEGRCNTVPQTWL